MVQRCKFSIELKNFPPDLSGEPKLAPTAHQLSKKFIGYGHYELTISSSEGTKTIVTRNMDLIERLNSEIDKEKEEATAEAIALVLESSP